MDIVIKNGLVVDGTSNPWVKADVAIQGERIAKLGSISDKAEKIIDASGLVVCPGFIDMHSHSDLAILSRPPPQQKIRQGVTTELLGQDGLSVAPVKGPMKKELAKYLAGIAGELDREWPWSTVGEYLKEIERCGIQVNVATYVGHGTVRMTVSGFVERPVTSDELEAMKELVDQSMRDGAFGLSSGLVYAPGSYADTNELVALAEIAAKRGGIYTSHIRGESGTLEKSLEEALTIGKSAGLPVHISHHKAAGRMHWGKVKKTLAMIDDARSRGLDVTCDQYPYTAGSTMLSVVIPPWAHKGGVEKLLQCLKDPEARERMKRDMETELPGWTSYYKQSGWDKIQITFCKKNTALEGKTIEQIAELRGTDPFTAAFDLLVDEETAVSMVIFYLSEDDVRTVMRHPATMVGTDGLMVGNPHPRVYGTYPRILGRYVRDEKVLTLEDAIRKMTSLPAQRLGLQDRGLIRPGMFADIAVFNPKTIIDKATYEKPHQYSVGVECVVVNGAVVLEKGEVKETLPGKVLRKAWSSSTTLLSRRGRSGRARCRLPRLTPPR